MTENRRIALLMGAAALAPLAAAAVAQTLPSTLAGLAASALVAGAALLQSRKPPAKTAPPPMPAQAERDGEFARAATQASRHRAWVEAILRDIPEGMVLCGPDHRILHVNAAATRLLDGTEGLAPGRPLFSLLSREPVLRGLDSLLAAGAPPTIAFAGATLDARCLLHGRMVLVRDADGFAGYVLILVDAGSEAAMLAEDNRLRRLLTRELRQPLANLQAAAETMAAYPGMSPRERAAFDEVVLQECAALIKRVEGLEAQAQRRTQARWPLAAVHSQDLFNIVARDAARAGLILCMEGLPLWLKADGRALPAALGVLVAGLAEATGRRRFDLEALLSDRNVTLDIAWVGAPVPSGVIDTWLDRPLHGAVSGETVRDVLERHNSEPWSLKLRNGATVLRIPLPAPDRPQFSAEDSSLPPRPEFHDAQVMRAHAETGAKGQLALAQLPMVAFDVETTGLKPGDGDQMVQLGALRMAQGRPQPESAFNRLINPGRPIPAEATRVHGITDAMVAEKPPPSLVLRQFRDYVGDAVLVGHNVAFDLSFVEAEDKLDNPVLDTLLLALVAESDADPALPRLARRLWVTPDPHASALGDAMTTAEVLSRLLPRLAERGIHTLDDAIAAQMALLGGL